MVEFCMSSAVTSAPVDPHPELPAWAAEQLCALQAQVAERDSKLAVADAEIKRHQLKIQRLTLELAVHKRIRFGAKSEAFTTEQRVLFDESCEEDGAAITSLIAQQQPAPSREYKRTGRNPLPENLRRIEHRHDLESCTCSACGHELTKIGEDISEQLDCEPADFFVHRHIRPQYACRTCETVVAADVPAALIDGGLAAPGLHAWVLIQKYLDHLPLYRIEQIAARSGVTLARSTLGQWVGEIGVRLEPLVDRLMVLLKQGTVLHADETPIQQLDPGNGKTKRAYLWAYRSNDLSGGPPIVVFDYQTSRAGEHARNFLAGWQGHLMVDHFAGYKAGFKQGLIELGCLAHARRKFFDLHKAGQHPVAEEALVRIKALYEIEAEAKDLDIAGRFTLRQSRAVPLLADFHTWLTTQRARTAAGGGLMRAIDYSLKRWPALVRYTEAGHLPIDNNPVENTIRPIALGRRNWLFAGSERAGCRAAAIQSLLATAKLNGLEPYAWLKATLEKLPAWPDSRIDELLPLRRATTLT